MWSADDEKKVMSETKLQNKKPKIDTQTVAG